MKLIFGAILATLVSTSVLAAPPSAPSSISARTTSSGFVEINWSRATDSDGTVVGYEVLRNRETIPVGNVTQYIDNNVDRGVTYTYRVVAIDNTNERAVSNSSVTVTLSNNGSSISSSGGGSIQPVQSNGQTTSANQSNSQSSNSQRETSSPQSTTSAQTTVATILACIDSDGDGWGWDGYESCIVEAVNQSICAKDLADDWVQDSQFCIDSASGASATAVAVCIDVDGDGWGWTGTDSCKIELDTLQHVVECIDTDGDGWGWTGTDSCIP